MDDAAIDRAIDRLRAARRRLGIDNDALGAERARREAERAQRRKNKEHGE